MRRVYKYGTGQDIPSGKYLCTVVEPGNPRFVWHYYEVYVEE